ncbi:MAG: hypothetical protein ACRETT_06540 [Steroidobacteraceae bacterium]
MDLTHFARKYIWWLPPDEAVRDRHRVIAQVMNLGTLEDVEALRRLVGDEQLRQALREARAGEFSDRSWHYWHRVLSTSELHEVPAAPARKYS